MNPYLSSPDILKNNIHKPVLKVLGLGGGGCNAIERMMEHDLHGVEFIAANTDHQVLKTNSAPVKIQLGPQITRGLGAGGNPQIGELAAMESSREIAKALQGADMVFLTAGMGGGTGTGSIPVAAEIARSLGAVTIAIVTTPFSFEMGKRQRNAVEGLAKLRQHTNTLISIPNDKLLEVAPRNLALDVAFRIADDVLRQSVQGISELITEPGIINVDFAHIRRLIGLGGGAFMAIGVGEGPNKARMALDNALHHPLLDEVNPQNAAGVIANFTAGDDLSLAEINDALTHLQTETGEKTEIVMGVINDSTMQDRAQVILIVTGLGGSTLEEALSSVSRRTAPRIAETPRHTIADARPVFQPATVEPIREAVAPVAEPPQKADIANLASDLDLPAFLRRRARLASPGI